MHLFNQSTPQQYYSIQQSSPLHVRQIVNHWSISSIFFLRPPPLHQIITQIYLTLVSNSYKWMTWTYLYQYLIDICQLGTIRLSCTIFIILHLCILYDLINVVSHFLAMIAKIELITALPQNLIFYFHFLSIISPVVLIFLML